MASKGVTLARGSEIQMSNEHKVLLRSLLDGQTLGTGVVLGEPGFDLALRHAAGTRRCHCLAASPLGTLWPITLTFLVSTTDPALFSSLTVAVPVSSLPDSDTVVRARTCRTCPFGNSVL